MGIQELGTWLRSMGIVPTEMDLKEFRRMKIALDLFTILYSHFKVSVRYVASDQENIMDVGIKPDFSRIIPAWTQSVFGFITRLKDNDITPVICYDGVAPPSKSGTKTKRFNAARTALQEVEDAKREAATCTDTHRLAQLRDIVIRGYEKGFHPSKEDISNLVSLIDAYGFPVNRAVGEGEQLAAELCRQGYVHAVYSGDHDCLMYNPEMWICDYDSHTRKFRVHTMENILRMLDMTHAQFMDMCIFFGCDHNERYSRYGPQQIYPDIKKYGSGPELIARKRSIDFSVVNYQYCVEYFSMKECDALTEGGMFVTDMADSDHEMLSTASEKLGVKIKPLPKGPVKMRILTRKKDEEASSSNSQ